MTQAEFDDIVESRITKIRQVLTSKGIEYAAGEDRMHNFKAGAAFQGISPVQCLRGYLTKHVVSIYAMLDCPEVYRSEVWEEKIGDAINYLILLEALLTEE